MKDTYHQILDLLRRLEKAKIAYSLRQIRDEAIMVEVEVPGERWEIEFVDYNDEVHIEIERFRSDGHISDASSLDELFANFSDEDEPTPSNEHTRKAREVENLGPRGEVPPDTALQGVREG